MRGSIKRKSSYTLGVEWCDSKDDIDCDACQGTISGEAYAIMPPKEGPLVFCRTCALELRDDLAYALT